MAAKKKPAASEYALENKRVRAVEARLVSSSPAKTSPIERAVPEGEWDFLIPKGKCRVVVTQAGDPRLIIPHRLEKAIGRRANEQSQGSEIALSIIFFDDNDAERWRAGNLMKSKLRDLCDAVRVDYDSVYPTEVTQAVDFDSLFRALEDKRGKCWTVHTERQNTSGEKITDVELHHKQPLPGSLANLCQTRHTQGMPTRNVNLTEKLDRFIADEIASGRYENASEVVRASLRALEREEQEYAAKLAAIDRALEEGEASGIAEDYSIERIIADLDAEAALSASP